MQTPTRIFMLAAVLGLAGRPAAAEPAAVAEPPRKAQAAGDPIRMLQCEAEVSGHASWGHWGDNPDRYVAWSNHSNRLIPVYTFGIDLDAFAGAKSVYRDEARLRELYGRLPDDTLNPQADYFDQTDIYRLQLAAADAGKKYIVLFVFDGMDWVTTRAAAIATTGRVAYAEGRGTGFAFQDYRGCPTDFGFVVTSPVNDGTKVDADVQAVKNPGGKTPGGYDAARGGATPWERRPNLTYLIGRDRDRPHAVTDSAASATALCAGRKTYNVSRDDYQDIARDMLGEPSVSHPEPLAGLEVAIGAGCGVLAADDSKQQGRNYEPGNKYLADSTLAAIDAANGGRYRVAQRTAGRAGADVLTQAAADAAAQGLRLFGFFGTAQGNLPFRTADGDFNPGNCNPEAAGSSDEDRLRKKYGSQIHYTASDIEENPTLAEMATAALDVLGRRERFWLMVEAGDVDWACHANNIDTAIGAVQSGDAAFRAVVDWIEKHDAWADAAVIVTSDHGHLFVLTEPEALSGQ